ncbi:hypothetical protein PHYC_03284 [Phycisphaerales bacterium]|nr:hypothetical protein PHYC_03284 [Phycisphaerales bacterium]
MLVLAGAAMGVLGLPGEDPSPAPAKIEIPRVASDLPTAAEGVELRTVDYRAMATRMDLFGNAPKKPDVKTDEKPGVAPALQPPSEARYIGTLVMGPKLFAIVVDGARQRVMKVGDTFADGSRVVSITETEMVVEGPGGRRTIPLAERTGEGISRATPTAPSPAMARGGVPVAKPAAASSNIRGNKLSMSAPVKGSSRRAGMPDGSPERFDEIVQQMRASGRYPDENGLMEAAKEQFEQEAVKSDGVKGGQH